MDGPCCYMPIQFVSSIFFLRSFIRIVRHCQALLYFFPFRCCIWLDSHMTYLFIDLVVRNCVRQTSDSDSERKQNHRSLNVGATMFSPIAPFSDMHQKRRYAFSICFGTAAMMPKMKCQARIYGDSWTDPYWNVPYPVYSIVLNATHAHATSQTASDP